MTPACYAYEATRYVRGRHTGACDGSECSGCQPCTEAHCETCSKVHVDTGEQNCAGCIGKTRTNLRELVDLYAAVPTEAEYQGVDSEAANLAGPATNAEAWSWRKVHVSKTYGWAALEDDDEHHPLNVLGRWVFALGEDYGDPTDLQLTMSRAVDYLDRRLGRLAHDVGQDWGLFAREVRRCKAHLEAVLHDGEQRDTGAPCMACEVPQRHIYEGGDMPWSTEQHAAKAVEDGWACPRCRRWSNENQYRFSVKHLHREEADWLTDHDMEMRTGVKAGTVRVWAKRGEVAKRADSGRTLYSVADVETRMGKTPEKVS